MYEWITNDSSCTTASSCTTECVLSLSLSVKIRPTVSRPVYLGIKHPSGAYDQIFITVRQLWVCWCGTLSLTKGRVCRLQLLLASPAQSFSDSSPVGLATVFYCLRFETSILSRPTTRRATVEVFNPVSTRDLWMRSYLNGRLYSLAVSMENFYCVFVCTEAIVECSFTRKPLLNVRLHRNAFCAELVSRNPPPRKRVSYWALS
jgi:hypothetical protein